MSLYTDLVAAGQEVSNWQSDLYVVATEKSLEIIREHKASKSAFKSQVDGRLMYEVPFAFDPFWNSRQPKAKATS